MPPEPPQVRGALLYTLAQALEEDRKKADSVGFKLLEKSKFEKDGRTGTSAAGFCNER